MQTYRRGSSIEELLVPSYPKGITSLLHQDSTLVAGRLGSKEACRADGRLRVRNCDVRWEDWRFRYWIQKPVGELKLVGEIAAAQDRAVGVEAKGSWGLRVAESCFYGMSGRGWIAGRGTL